MKIIFLTPYPSDTVGSQRFRFEQYLSFLQESGFKVRQYSLYSHSVYRLLQRKSAAVTKLLALLIGFIRRIFHLIRVGPSDIIFVHRELFPIGPPFFEWFITKALRKRMIYDFDDAIWLTDNSNENKIEIILRNRSKVAKISSWSSTISAGNSYLADYAKQYNEQVHTIPTTIDLDKIKDTKQLMKNSPVTIGWTGTHSTLKYLNEFIPIFEEIGEVHNTKLLIIADRDPNYTSTNYEFIRWSREREIQDLLRIDIGIMPMPDNVWTRGKCGFKALQYMALGIPVVASPVGANISIIKNGKNGLLASNTDEWLKQLEKLITNPKIRQKLGSEGQQTVADHYSVRSQQMNYLEVFETESFM